MKTFKISILTIALFAFTLSMTSCGGSSEHNHEDMEDHGTEHMEDNHDDKQMEDHADEHMDEHVFACPMHPEVTGKEGDKCSKCGMDLKMMGKEDSHEGHNH